MKKLNHANIIKLYEMYDQADQIMLIMELCKGGELFDYIKQKKKFSEREAATIIK